MNDKVSFRACCAISEAEETNLAQLDEEIKAIFGADTEYHLRRGSLNFGASVGAVFLEVVLPIVGGISGIAYLQERFKDLKLGWKKKGLNMFCDMKVALTLHLLNIFEQDEIGAIRLLRAMEIRSRLAEHELGEFPICYCYAIGLVRDQSSGTDALHVIVINDRGELIFHERTKAKLFLCMFGDPNAVDAFLRGLPLNWEGSR